MKYLPASKGFMSSSSCFCYKSREVLDVGDKTIVTMYSPLHSLWQGHTTRHALCLGFGFVRCGEQAISFRTGCFMASLTFHSLN